MVEVNDNELAALIQREEQGFFERFRTVMSQLADEGIEFRLPFVIIDHVANTENN